MNVDGSNFAFHQLSLYQPAVPPPGSGAPGGHNVPAAVAPSGPAAPVPGGTYMPVAGMAYLSSGYFAVAPQLAAFSNPAAGSSAVPGGASQSAPTATAAGSAAQTGHVTANATNSMASAMMAGGYPPTGAAAMGMAGMMAMPIGVVFAQPVILMPVFFGFLSQGTAMMSSPAAATQEPVSSVADVPAAPPPAATQVSEDAGPSADKDIEQQPIRALDAADFKRFRQSQLNAELSTSLVLQLKTKDGDTISLNFSQIDLLERSNGKDATAENAHKVSYQLEESTDRVVNMSVDGTLDEAERVAIDALLADVIEVANAFFNDKLDGALNKLQTMELDTATLAEFSLKMNMTKSVEYSRTGGHDDMETLQRLARRDGEVSKVLDFFADQQRKLIDSASEVLDRPSAVKMVKSLLPPMLETPFAQLAGKLNDAAVAAVETILDSSADGSAKTESEAVGETAV